MVAQGRCPRQHMRLPAALTRSEYKVLQHLMGSDGDIATAREALRRDPSVRDADWQSALEVFRHHKRYKGEA